jgi:hypothetical protein
VSVHDYLLVFGILAVAIGLAIVVLTDLERIFDRLENEERS